MTTPDWQERLTQLQNINKPAPPKLPKQNYSYRYPGETMVRNLSMWDLPPKYAHLTLEELSMAEVAVCQ
jgi:hypothetical protein